MRIRTERRVLPGGFLHRERVVVQGRTINMKIATKNSSSAFAGSGRINEDPDFGLELSSLEIRHQQLSEEYQQLRRIAAERAQNIIDRFELTAEDVTLHERRSAFHSAPNKVTPKYRGPNGELWSGRGKLPVWLQNAIKNGAAREDFLIERG